jgi:flagellar secretion chaperone FliS
MTPYATAQQAYRDSSVLTAPPERLVVMLYDGTRRFLAQGAHAMREGNIALSNNRLQRAEAILDELLSTLDMEAGGDIAVRLQSIYLFCRRTLAEGRMEGNPEKFEQVSRLLGELREAWDEIAGA